MEMEPAQRFEDLIVWQKSHALTLRVYRMTRRFPKQEVFGLTSQMRRAAVSVPSNIAEAFSKRGRPDKARIMNISQASLEELRYYFILARDLKYLAARNIGTISTRSVGCSARTSGRCWRLLAPSS